jgi:hypothetical protein
LGCSKQEFTPDLNSWASEAAQFCTLNGKLSQSTAWRRAWKKESWLQRLSGLAILPDCPQSNFGGWWMESLQASRAKTSQLQGGALASTESDPAFSSKCSMLQMIAVRGSSFWRTSQASLLPPPPLWTKRKANSMKEQPPESWENWPTVGGMRNGSLFLRPMWVPVMGVPGGSASHGGWATPDCNTSTRSNGMMGPNIREQASQWMTPNVPNGGRSVSAELVASKGMTAEGEKRTVGLESQIRHWATPNAHDGRRPGADLNSTQGMNLSRDAAMWPTPMA